MHPAATDDCPRCGAPRPHDSDTERQDCSFCGAPLRKRREPPTPRAPQAPRSQSTPFVWALVGAGVLVTLGALSAFVTTARGPTSGAALPGADTPVRTQSVGEPVLDTAPATPPPRARVLSGLLLLSSSENESEALLATLELLDDTNKRLLAALNPNTGALLWSQPLQPSQSNGPRAVVNGTLIVSGAQTLNGLDPTTGEGLWQRSLERVPQSLCQGRNTVGVSTALGFTAFASTTGSPIPADPKHCTSVYSSHSAAPNFRYAEVDEVRHWLPRSSRLAPLRGLLPQRGAARVVLGKETGNSGSASSSVGIIAGKGWLWQASLGTGQNDGAAFLSPGIAAVRAERVVVPYRLPDKAEVQLVCFDLASGRRLWTRSLDSGPNGGKSDAPPELLVTRDGRVLYLNEQGTLRTLNLDEGTEQWSMGVP
jgi:PQQ-like domain